MIPTAEECTYISDCILNELEIGIVNDQTAAQILHIMEHMVAEQKIEAVILGCTELHLLFEGCVTPVPRVGQFLNCHAFERSGRWQVL